MSQMADKTMIIFSNLYILTFLSQYTYYTYKPKIWVGSGPQYFGTLSQKYFFLGTVLLSVFFGLLIHCFSSSVYRQQRWTCSQQDVCSTMWSAGGSTLLVMHWDDRLTSCQENIHSRILWMIYTVRAFFAFCFESLQLLHNFGKMWNSHNTFGVPW